MSQLKGSTVKTRMSSQTQAITVRAYTGFFALSKDAL